MKLQLEGQSIRVRLGEAELDRLLKGEELTERLNTPLADWAWSVALGGSQGLTCLATGGWLLTIPDVEFRAFSAKRPRRDGFVLDLPVPDAAPLRISVEVDVRESRRREREREREREQR